MTLRIAPEVVIENIDHDVLALDGNTQTVHRFTGSHAEALILIKSGEPANGFDAEIAELTQLGLLATTEGLSRRSVLLGGSALAGSTAVALSMPVAAMAQSGLSLFSQEIGNRDFVWDKLSPPGLELEIYLDIDGNNQKFDGLFAENQTWTLEIVSADPLDPSGSFTPPLVLTGVTGLNNNDDLALKFISADSSEALGVQTATVFTARLKKGGFQTNLFTIALFSD
jgi:hypothetical protein